MINLNTKHVLIDTNIWEGIIKEPNADGFIDILETLIESKHIQVIVPQLIIQEFNRLNVNLPKIKKGRGNELIDSLLQDKNKDIIKYLLDDDEKIESNRRIRINRILNELSLILNVSPDVDRQVMERFRNRLAPFHKKTTSHNDATIYLSSIEHIKAQNLDNLILVTANTDDYSNPTNIPDLHPDLLIDGININYYLALKQFIMDVFPEHLVKNEIPRKGYAEISICFDSSIKIKSPIEQLLLSLKYYINFTGYIPSKLLRLIYPIKIRGKGYAEVEGSTLNTNNKVLILALIENTAQGPPHSPDLLEIKKILNSCFISKIIYYRKDKMEIDFSDDDICECLFCKYKRLEYKSLLNELDTKPGKDVLQNLTLAFIYYEISDFSKSFEFIKAVYDAAIKSKNNILTYIAAKNITNLKDAFFWNSDDYAIRTEIDTLYNQINLDNIYITSYTDDFSKFYIEEIHELRGFISTKLKIAEILIKIKKEYEQALRGSHVFNNYIKIVINTFADYQNFVWKNRLFISHYSNLSDLFEYVLEAYFISLKLNEIRDSDLPGLDDYLINQIITFGEPEKILKIVTKYKNKNIKYIRTEKNSAFVSTTKSLIANFETITAKNPSGGNHFREKYTKQIFVAISLLSVLELSADDINSIFEDFLTFTKTHDFKNRRIYDDPIPALLYRQETKISSQVFTLFLECFIINNTLHSYQMVHAIVHYVKRNNPTILSENSMLCDLFLDNFVLNVDAEDDNKIEEYIPILYEILSRDVQIKISDWIIQKLSAEFSPTLYYTYAIHDIIDYKIYYRTYVKSIQPVLYTGIFTNSEIKNESLNHLINLSLKNKIKLNTGTYNKFLGLSRYYDWLLNMNGFDYTEFNPIWILEYNTIFYLKSIFKCKKVKAHLSNYFREDKEPNKKVMELFLRYS